MLWHAGKFNPKNIGKELQSKISLWPLLLPSLSLFSQSSLHKIELLFLDKLESLLPPRKLQNLKSELAPLPLLPSLFKTLIPEMSCSIPDSKGHYTKRPRWLRTHRLGWDRVPGFSPLDHTLPPDHMSISCQSFRWTKVYNGFLWSLKPVLIFKKV